MSDITEMRKLLAPMVNKVPTSINSASVQVVREWKGHVVKARKALENHRSGYEKLHSAYIQLSQYL